MRMTASLPPGCILADIISSSVILGEAVEELAIHAAGSLLNPLLGHLKARCSQGKRMLWAWGLQPHIIYLPNQEV